jgi:tRNA (cmo5U34)-methyltransferase
LADPAEAMLVQARTRLAGNITDRLTILPTTDSAGLNRHIQRGTADVVTAIQCHHYLQTEGRRQAVQACFDLPVPGGLFVTLENVASSTPNSSSTVRKLPADEFGKNVGFFVHVNRPT